MPHSQPTLFNRHDTFLGVCEGLGQDFGFNANYLRLALALGLLLSPVATIAGYVGMGILIAVSRRIFPSQPAAVRQLVSQSAEPAAALKGDNDADRVDLATAA